MVNKINHIKSVNVLFEPINAIDLENELVIAKSFHINNEEIIYCNVMNTSDHDVTILNNKILGQLHEVELANERFEEEVKKYKPLNVTDIKSKAMQRGSKLSKLKKPDNAIDTFEPYLTTDDLIAHEIKQKLKNMKCNSNLSSIQKAELLEVILKNLDAFQWDDTKMGQTKLAVHRVPTTGPPVVQRQYVLPSIAREQIEQHKEKMLQDKVISPSTSNWRSPVMLVRKKSLDGKIEYRFCVDLRKVNSVTAKDCYSLPIIAETSEALSGAEFFSALDVDRAFWQIPVFEPDKEKLSFVVDGKTYQFNVMPFGSMNAPATFQRLIDRILRGLTWKQCLVYIDDVLIFSKTFEDHLIHLDQVLNRFILSGLKLKPTKCAFGDQEVEYLGFRFSKKGMRASKKKLETIMNLKLPETNKNLYRFLCSMNYYRGLIPKFADITADLYNMTTNRKSKCVWTNETKAQYKELKTALISSPILAYPDFSKPFIINTDASDKAIAGVLLQEINGIWRPIGFCSRKLSPAERRYSATEREMLAIKYSYFQFISIVFDRQIKFITDHKPLATAAKLKKPDGRLGKLFNDLYDDGVKFTIEWIAGDQNHLPDFLSRCDAEDKLESKAINVNVTELKSSIDWATVQDEDKELKQIKQLVVNRDPMEEWFKQPNGKRWHKLKADLYVFNKTLMYNERVVCPDKEVVGVMNMHHKLPLAGHKSSEATLNSVRKHYFWLNMATQIEDYCKSCHACQSFNYSTFKQVAPLKPIQVHRPMQIIGTDFMGPLRPTKSGKKYITLAICHWTKYLVGRATTDCTAETTAKMLFEDVICKHGICEQILSDQGTNYEAQMIKQLCALLGCDKIRTTTYMPSGNGITERVNKTIKPNLAKLVETEENDWDFYLQMAISAYNTTVHSTTGISPYEAMYGRKPVTIAEVVSKNSSTLDEHGELDKVSDFIANLKDNAIRINDIIEKHTRLSQEKQKQNYDKFVKGKTQYKIGDIVKIPNNIKNAGGKVGAFEKKFYGPYKIVDRLGDLTFRLESVHGNLRPETVHYNKLSKYHLTNTTHQENINTPEINTSTIPSNISKPNESHQTVKITYFTRSRRRMMEDDISSSNTSRSNSNDSVTTVNTPSINVSENEGNIFGNSDSETERYKDAPQLNWLINDKRCRAAIPATTSIQSEISDLENDENHQTNENLNQLVSERLLEMVQNTSYRTTITDDVTSIEIPFALPELIGETEYEVLLEGEPDDEHQTEAPNNTPQELSATSNEDGSTIGDESEQVQVSNTSEDDTNAQAPTVIKIRCELCGKKFLPKGIKIHSAACKRREKLKITVEKRTKALIESRNKKKTKII